MGVGCSLRRTTVDRDSATFSSGSRRRIENFAATQAIEEVGCNFSLVVNTVDEIRCLMDEGMFVADDVSRRPPLGDVGMAGFSHHDGSETLG